MFMSLLLIPLGVKNQIKPEAIKLDPTNAIMLSKKDDQVSLYGKPEAVKTLGKIQ